MSKAYSIKEAAAKLNLSEVYIRRLISQKKLATTKVQLSESVFKHMISEDDVEKLNNKHLSSKTQRKDGRNKYTLYATLDELKIINDYFSKNNINVIIERTNKTEDNQRRYKIRKMKLQKQ